MLSIDSHQHFWRYSPGEYPWIQSNWPIRRDFLPQDLHPLLRASGFDACVAVQARQTLEETRRLLTLADHHPFIAGVVGWVDLRSKLIEEQLTKLSRHPKLAGVRHVVQDEPDPNFLVRPEFVRGISYLNAFHLAYDILIFPKQLPAAIELVRKFPQQRFVLDHLAKPLIKEGQLDPWSMHIRELAQSPNVYCKLSGMVTEAKWRQWKPLDFRPYLDVVWEAFGEDRLMVGSDWPVCLLSGDYPEAMKLTADYLAQFPKPAQDKVRGGNAARFYQFKGISI